MRSSRLFFVAFAALVVTSGSAYAIDVNKKIAAPGQMMVLWSTISEFCSIKDWHPAIADCKESKEGDATFRVLTLKDNGGTIKEKLTGSDDTSYSYEIVESPLPVKNYSAKLWVEPDDRDPAAPSSIGMRPSTPTARATTRPRRSSAISFWLD